MKKYILLILLLFLISVKAQNISKLEYFIDSDPGFGLAQNVSGIPTLANVNNYLFAIPATVSSGIHAIGIRSQDQNSNWSHTNFQFVNVFTPEVPSNITTLEYFIDTDPGLGNAISVTGFTSQINVSNYGFTIPNTLVSGVHNVGYRTKDANDKWSHTNFSPFYVNEDHTLVDIVAVEYFWDTDKGFNNNDVHTVSPQSNSLVDYQFNIIVPNLSEGTHRLFSRTRDANGKWSHTTKADVLLGLADLLKIGFQIYPNPVVNELHIDTNDNSKCRVVLYDLTGKLITDKVINGSGMVDMSSLSNGVYMAYLWKEQNTIQCIKIVKQ